MSLNLLLGYTGQLSLGHVAFFGIGAYVSALTSLGFDVGLSSAFASFTSPGRRLSALCWRSSLRGYAAISSARLSFRVRGAYFVIVTITFAEVVRLVALNWVELTQGPLALTNIPSITLGLPGFGDLDSAPSCRTTISCSSVAVVAYRPDLAPGAFAFRPRHARR